MSTFEQDLFISYAHLDNQPLTAEQEGWISRFHASLSALLSMRLGKQARIWRDDKLQGNDVFADEIVEQFGRTAVLLSVLSPRYLKSHWCTREVNEFCARAERSGGIVVSNKARVFKIVKTPVDSEDPLPPLMQSLLGYEFFTMEDGTPLELDAAYGEKYAQGFNRKVNQLAYEIARLLTTLEENAGPARAHDAPMTAEPANAPPAAPTGFVGADAHDDGTGRPAIPEGVPEGTSSDAPPADERRRLYLAECSFDLKEQREMLHAELLRLGHEVLPDRRLPHDETDYVGAVESLLARCELSIHLVGAHAGAVADGPSGKSLTEWQNELAARRSDSAGLPRLIWLPEGTRGAEPRQQAFIEALHGDADAQRGADLVTGGQECLKRAVFAALEPAEQQQPEEPLPGDDGWTLLHLLCTSEDRRETVPLRRFLKAQGVDVTLPAFHGDAAQVRAANRRLLDRCDAVLVYYGRGDEAWKRTIDTELRKLPALRADGTLPPVHTFLAAPRTIDKEDLIDMAEDNLVDALDGLVDARLAPVLASVGIAATPAATVEPA